MKNLLLTSITLFSLMIAFFPGASVAWGQSSVIKTWSGSPSYYGSCPSYSCSIGSISFAASDFPAGEQVVDDVNITITFLMYDDGHTNCSGEVWWEEYGQMDFLIEGPSHTEVIAAQNTWADGNGLVYTQVTFDQQAASTPNGMPATGSFKPYGGNLGNMTGSDALGTWTLRVGTNFPHNSWYGVCIQSFSVELSATIPLPVELYSFEAIDKENSVELLWNTVTETNNESFSLEKSGNLEDWEVISSQPGAGNSSDLKKYQAEDNQPNSGFNCYRLKMTDNEGKATYSDVASVWHGESATEVIIYPLPATDRITLKGDNEEIRNYSIYSLTGVELSSLCPIIEDTDHGLLLDLEKLPVGIYFLKTPGSTQKFLKKNP